MKKLLTITLAIGMMAALAATANAADYHFETADNTSYYKSTNYEDKYDAQFNYDGKNQVELDIPEIKYGLAQEFLESSLNNPYLGGGIQYGLSVGTAAGSFYPTFDSGSSSSGTISVSYVPDLTISDLKQKDGSIGKVTISRVGLSAKVYEGATSESMNKGAGHYAGSALWTGNVALFGHNRGSCAYFAQLKNVKAGDTVTYKTNQGTKTYEVKTVSTIASDDYSYLNEMGDDRITMITCIANQPSLRLCVQAVEI